MAGHRSPCEGGASCSGAAIGSARNCAGPRRRIRGRRPIRAGCFDEALGFANGPRRVGLGADVLDPKGFEQLGKGGGAIAGTVVGQDPLEGDSQAGVVLQSAQQRLAGGFGLFIGVDAAEGDPG